MKESIYYSIYKEYKDKILSNEIKVGEALLSERDLSLKHNVSRNTIRRMLDLLENDNLIYKVQGKGNIVSTKKITQNLNAFYSFYEQMMSLGKKPSSRVLTFKMINCNDKLSEIFNAPLSSKFYYIKRLRLIDDKGIMLENTYIPVSRFKDFDYRELNKTPMYEIFKNKYNVVFEKAIENLKPIILTLDEEVKYLEVEKYSPAMKIERITYEGSKVIEYTVSHVRGDMFEYKVVLNNIQK